MKIPFVLLSETTGEMMVGKSALTRVRISKDCAEFVSATNSVEEFSAGYYSFELSDEEADVQNCVVIEITCPEAQLIVKQWTPDKMGQVDEESIADAVWNRTPRELTSEAKDIIDPDNSNATQIITPVVESISPEEVTFIKPNS